MTIDPVSGWPVFCRQLFEAALAAVDPFVCVPPALPDPYGYSSVKLIAAGKAAASMASATVRAWPGVPVEGLVVCPYGYSEPIPGLEVREAAHPVPDQQSVAAADAALALAQRCGPDDLLLFLVSGGGSSLLCAPAAGLGLSDKRGLTGQLLRSGATIREINCVRQQLSRIKGGGLLAAASQARTVMTLAISDVVGDDPAVIASGPTLAPIGTKADAEAVLARYQIDPPAAWRKTGLGPAACRESEFHILGSGAAAIEAAARVAVDNGMNVTVLGTAIEGEARVIAEQHASRAYAMLQRGMDSPHLLLSGGELTVTVKGEGQGGPNQEYLLALANALHGQVGWAAFAADTDGQDGSGGAAGAYITASHLLAHCRRNQLESHLLRNDSYNFFNKLGMSFKVLPTKNNVNDLRAILLYPLDYGLTDEHVK